MERDGVRRRPQRIERPQGTKRIRWAALAALGAAIWMLAPAHSAAQQTSIGGVVVDAQTQRPLSTAQVFIPGRNQGTLTGDDGRFVITGVTGPVQVQVTLIGYADQVLEARPGDMNLRFELKQAAISLNALVVTGTPGAIQKKALGNVVSTINASEIAQKAPVSDLQQVLNGRVAGVTVLSSTGEVGGASRIPLDAIERRLGR